MLRFIAGRFAGMVITMVAASLLVFIIIQLPPGDYAERYAFRKFSGSPGVVVTESDIQNLRVRWGLDKPLWNQYLRWIWGIVSRGDFGRAFAFETSVSRVIGQRIWLTMALLFGALFLTYLIAIPLGAYIAVHKHSFSDYTLTILSYLGLAVPGFLLALFLVYLGTSWFDVAVGGFFSPEYKDAPWSIGKVFDFMKNMIIPTIVLAWAALAIQIQTMRSTMLDEINKLSVVAARARGNSETKVIMKYPTRLAVNPVIGSIGFDANRVFSQLPIVALVLGLPELGQLLLVSFLDQDMYVAGAILLILTFIVVVMNFVSDIILAILDPRIKLKI